MQATLCWTRLVANLHLAKGEPVTSERNFENGLHALLLHDISYLKEKGDNQGSGARFTFMHVQRNCALADLYLIKKDWSRFEIYVIQHIISCTDPHSIIDAGPFNNDGKRISGKAVCTADFLYRFTGFDLPEYCDDLFCYVSFSFDRGYLLILITVHC